MIKARTNDATRLTVFGNQATTWIEGFVDFAKQQSALGAVIEDGRKTAVGVPSVCGVVDECGDLLPFLFQFMGSP